MMAGASDIISGHGLVRVIEVSKRRVDSACGRKSAGKTFL
jgi:hypothetical protein